MLSGRGGEADTNVSPGERCQVEGESSLDFSFKWRHATQIKIQIQVKIQGQVQLQIQTCLLEKDVKWGGKLLVFFFKWRPNASLWTTSVTLLLSHLLSRQLILHIASVTFRPFYDGVAIGEKCRAQDFSFNFSTFHINVRGAWKPLFFFAWMQSWKL